MNLIVDMTMTTWTITFLLTNTIFDTNPISFLEINFVSIVVVQEIKYFIKVVQQICKVFVKKFFVLDFCKLKYLLIFFSDW